MIPKVFEKEEDHIAIIQGFDNTILKLNNFLDNAPFRYIHHTEFESKYRKIFCHYDQPFGTREPQDCERNGGGLTTKFFRKYMQERYSGTGMYNENGFLVFMLAENRKNTTPPNQEYHDFNNLMRSIRLVKGRSLSLVGYGIYRISDSYGTAWNPYAYEKHITDIGVMDSITDEDVLEIKKLYLYLKGKSLPRYIWLSIRLYNQASRIKFEEPGMKRITLISCLEALFNQSKNQISHIIARHASLIISDSNTEFEENYKLLKKYYGFRCNLVHGNDSKITSTYDKIQSETEHSIKLDLVVRECIKYSILGAFKSKKELFDHFNSMGT